MRFSVVSNAIRPFFDLAKAPRAIWYVVLAFVLDSTAYFGMLTLMTIYLSQDLGWGDAYAATTVSLFTMLVTLAMLGIGSVAESFGLRRAILFGLAVAVVGRTLYCLAPGVPVAAPWLIIGGLLLVAGSSGILQPVCYSGVKQFTDEKTSSMGYAVIYACMNLGIVLIGAVSAAIRPAFQAVLDSPPDKVPPDNFLSFVSSFSHSGVQAVNWLCCGLSLLALMLMTVLLSRRAEATRLRRSWLAVCLMDNLCSIEQKNTSPTGHSATPAFCSSFSCCYQCKHCSPINGLPCRSTSFGPILPRWVTKWSGL